VETTIDVHSQQYMETMARLMSEALETPDGMRALAAAIAEPIEQEIKRKESIMPRCATARGCKYG